MNSFGLNPAGETGRMAPLAPILSRPVCRTHGGRTLIFPPSLPHPYFWLDMRLGCKDLHRAGRNLPCGLWDLRGLEVSRFCICTGLVELHMCVQRAGGSCGAGPRRS